MNGISIKKIFFYTLVAGVIIYALSQIGGSVGQPAGTPSDPAEAQEPDTQYTHALTITRSRGGDPIKLKVEWAITEQQQQTGMMFRRSLGDDEGMIFIFGDDAMRTFWMKNTLIPLDMIFIDANGRIVSIHKKAVPNDLSAISSMVPARTVLEVRGGLSDEWGLSIGDLVEGIPVTKVNIFQ